jgi:hypothetical protein
LWSAVSDLSGVRIKVERARQHRGELKKQLDGWRKSKPYSVIVEIDSQTQEQLFKVGTEPSSPPDLPVIGDILYNLRSALDHLAWQLVLKAKATTTNKTEFPIFNDPNSWKRDSPRKMAGMNDLMQRRIRDHQPCFGKNHYRNDALWGLQEYGNTDKHRALLVVPVSTQDMLWSPGGNPLLTYKGPVSQGTVLVRFPPGQYQSQLHAMPSIAFSEPPSQGEDVQYKLRFMELTVNAIVDELDAAFFQ